MTNWYKASEQNSDYTHALEGEGRYWDRFIAERLRRGEIPGSIDWRLTFTQHRYNHGWRPFCLGPEATNFRLPQVRHILEQATLRPGMRVLDLGCGAGWLSLELARRSAHVTGLDISPTNLALARYMADTNARNFPYLYQSFAGLPCRLEQFGSVEYGYADLNTVTLPKGDYDAVVVWDSLHHVSELERLLEEVRTSLKPGGIFLGVDHYTPTRRAELFNMAALPWLRELLAWSSEPDHAWFFSSANELARRYDWGVLAVDYDPAPVPGFDPFQKDLLAEMLAIVEGGLNPPTAGRPELPAQAEPQSPAVNEESPFEDVSADRVLRVLRESFHAEQFATVCPFLKPESLYPPYRTDEERIFHHYLAATLAHIGERAIRRGETDGQWFFFHLTRERPSRSALPDTDTTESARGVLLPQQPAQTDEEPTIFAQHAHLEVELDERLAHIHKMETALEDQRRELDARAAYITHLEEELARKEAHIGELQGHLGWFERRLNTAVRLSPFRLPWKRRKP